MPKIFDCEDEPNEFMEMPCRCDCGMWFDLLDGHSSRKNNKVVCRECHEKEICKKCGGEGWIYGPKGSVRKCNCNNI